MVMQKGVRSPKNPRIRRMLIRELSSQGYSENYISALIKGKLPSPLYEREHDAYEAEQLLKNTEYQQKQMKNWLVLLKSYQEDERLIISIE